MVRERRSLDGTFQSLFPALIIVLLIAAGCHKSSGFVEGTTIGIAAHNPNAFPVIFFNTYTGEGLATFPENEWTTVDVTGIIPDGVKAIYLSGLLIITHGTLEEICNLTLAYRDQGETGDYPYIAQTVETVVNGGARTPHSIWVAAHDGKFQIKWRRSTTGNWPENCAYGINLNLAGYLR